MVVLLVEDDKDHTYLFREAIKVVDTKINLVTAEDGLDALQKLSSLPQLDFIFLDLNMPWVTGRDFLQRIKEDEVCAKIPIIIYTANSHPDDLLGLRELGATKILIKPNSFELLVLMLKEVIQDLGDGLSSSPALAKPQ